MEEYAIIKDTFLAICPNCEKKTPTQQDMVCCQYCDFEFITEVKYSIFD